MKERASGAGGSRRLPARSWLFDSALALVAAGLSTGLFTELMDVERPGPPRSTVVPGHPLVFMHTLPRAARRRFPLAGLAISVASGLAFAANDLPAAFLRLPI